MFGAGAVLGAVLGAGHFAAYDMLMQQGLNAQQMQARYAAESEAQLAARRARNKQVLINCRGARMERRLNRRRQAIRDKWLTRVIWALLILGSIPMLITVLGLLWRLAFYVVLS